MKKVYLFISILIFCQNAIFAQSEIWGMNASGANGYGSIYGLPTGSTGIATQYSFIGSPGSSPQHTKLLEATNGKLYGLAYQGGASNSGVLFQYDTTTNVYIGKYEFGGTAGANPRGALIQAQNGKLYGMTFAGGTASLGVIFEYDITTNTYTKKVDFTGTTGAAPGKQPFGTLCDPSPGSGKLYGMTRLGGVNDKGVLFEYNYITNVYTVKVDFDGNTGSALGSNPFGELTKAGSNLYGLASTGGTNNAGTLFEYDYTNNIFTKKIDLATSTGSGPQGSLMLASNGLLYGMTTVGGAGSPAAGTIFSYSIASNTYTKLYDFVGSSSNGANPFGQLIQATNGKLYGLTRLGGATNVGVLFEFDPSGSTFTKKIDFANTAAVGSFCFGSLIQVSTGKLYGLTSSGGNLGAGVLFNYVISSNTYTKKIDLNSSDGGTPNGPLIQASNGLLYGMTNVGGSNNVGVIFEYNRLTNTYTKKIDMSVTNGSYPVGGFVQASNNKLYGLTPLGGVNGVGTLFEYDPSTNTFTKKVDLTGTTGSFGGSYPYGSLVQYSGNNKLYGLTTAGGSSNLGVLFEYDPSTNTYTKKIDLLAANGYSAYGSLVESSGKLYGMTQLGGTNSLGVIFEYDPTTNTYTKKIDFSGTSGAAPGSLPYGSLVTTATTGVLYGMTSAGGTNSVGVIFEYNTSTNAYTSKFDFSSANGSVPYGSPIRAANGNLYGVTNQGGANSVGVLFEYNIGTSSYSKKIDFTNSTGNSPTVTQLLEVCTKPLTPGSITSSTNALCQGNAATKTFSISSVSNATSYAWTMPAGSSTVSGATTTNFAANLAGVSAGTYTYGVAGVNVCGSGALSVSTITVHALPTVSVNSGAFCSGSNFTITPSGASTYTVQGGSFVVSPVINTTYTLVGTSALGCVSSNTAVSSVTVNALPTIGVNSGAICSGNAFTIIPTGVVTSTVTGGSLIVSPTTNTTYAVTGTDANGCVSSNTAVSSVTVNALPVIGINNGTICSGKSHTFVPTGAATYTIQGGSLIVSPTSNSSYTVSGTSTAGCIAANSTTGNVLVNALPVIGINNGTICSGKSHTFVPTGASTYTIQGGSLIVSPTSNTSYTVAGTSTAGCVSASSATGVVTVNSLPIIGVNSGAICLGNSFTMVPTGVVSSTVTGGSLIVSPASNTSYSLTGTDANGCVSSNTAVSTVTVNPLPVISVNSGSICNGSNFTFTPSGASTYTIQGGSLIVSPNTSSSYTVAGTSTAGCVSAFPATGNVTVYALPVVSVNSGTICSGSNFTFTPSGASTYTIQGGTFVVSPTLSTSYTVTGTSTAGCVSASPATGNVTVYAPPVISVNSGTLCSGNSFTFSPSGASTYTITGGSMIVSPTVNTNYSVSGTSSMGCVSSAPAVGSVTVYALPTVTVNSGSVCLGKTFTIVPSGAGAGATYSVSPGGSTLVSPTVNSTYSVMATNTLGCVSSSPAISSVSVIALPVITVTDGAVCLGSTITTSVSGASSYTYISTTSTINATGNIPLSPNSTTSYSVFGTSAVGCQAATPAIMTITVNPLPPVSVSGPSAVCLGESATLTASGANTYNWGTSTGSTIVVNPSTSTTYSVQGTDANNCSQLSQFLVTVNPLPVISVISGAICPGDSFTLTPSGAATYTFSGGSNIVSPTTTTNYSVTGTSSLGCVSAQPAVATVSVVNILTVTISGVTDICIGNSTTLTANGANLYSWNTGDNGNTIVVTPSTSTTYTVVGTSGTCADSSTALVNVNPLPIVTISSTQTVICINESANLVSGGALSYTWSTQQMGSSIVVSPTITTVYSVIATDANGCVNDANYTLEVSDCVGIAKSQFSAGEFKLYPNPNEGVFTIECESVYTVVIMNAIGQQVMQQELSPGLNKIELDNCAKGVYFLNYKSGNSVKTIKIIKQ